MSLRNIVATTVAEFGIDVAQNYDWLLAQINNAAQELHLSLDLVGALREQVFILPSDEDVVTLPFYVGDIRAIRKPKVSTEITLTDLRPRYHLYQWGGVAYDKFRIIGTSPIARELPAEMAITYHPKDALFTGCMVSVVGSTCRAARTVESLFVTKEVTGTVVFTDIESISKSIFTNYDVDIYSGTTIIATIANCMLRSKYTKIQVSDNCLSNVTFCSDSCRCVEVLYKQEFLPFVNDSDEFICEEYDQAIGWQFGVNYTKSSTDKQFYADKVRGYCSNKARTQEFGKQIIINFGPNRFLESYRYVTGRFAQGRISRGNASSCCR